MKRIVCVCTLWVLWGVGSVRADELPDGVMCPVSGETVDAEVCRDYRDAHVYFCCDHCAKKFEDDHTAFVSKANHQLVLTRQAKQTACPFSGRPLKAGTTVALDGVDVEFCCGNCQKKMQQADHPKQLELAFSDEAFDKGFEVVAGESDDSGARP